MSILATRLIAKRAFAKTTAASRAFSTWGEVPLGPADPIFGLTQAFQEDTDPRKVSVGAGAYRGEDGLPYVLPSFLKKHLYCSAEVVIDFGVLPENLACCF